MMRRMGRPGLVGTMARTAVVAGTATAVAGGGPRPPTGQGAGGVTRRTPPSRRRSTHNSRSPRCRRRWTRCRPSRPPAAAPAPAPAAAAPAAAPDLMTRALQARRPEGRRDPHRRRVLRRQSQAAGLIARHDDRRRGHVSVHPLRPTSKPPRHRRRPTKTPRPGSAPGWLVWSMIVLASVVAIGASMNAWLNRQVLDTDNWVEASDQVLEEPAVRAALSTYLVNELFSYVDVSGAAPGSPARLVAGARRPDLPSAA